jgi:hypothetical protein
MKDEHGEPVDCSCCGHEADWPCPDCEEPTCESCFEPMTIFNSGNPTACMTCKESQDRWSAESHEYDEKMKKQSKKPEKPEKPLVLEFDMICENNIGMEDSFDLGVTYLALNAKEEGFLLVYDKMGKQVECLKDRFVRTV